MASVSPASYTCKDLILLQKYRDENYRRALVEMVVCRAKHMVLAAAMLGETAARITVNWASTQAEYDGLQKEEQQVREQLKEAFRDAVVVVDSTRYNFIITEYWELAIRVTWGA